MEKCENCVTNQMHFNNLNANETKLGWSRRKSLSIRTSLYKRILYYLLWCSKVKSYYISVFDLIMNNGLLNIKRQVCLSKYICSMNPNKVGNTVVAKRNVLGIFKICSSLTISSQQRRSIGLCRCSCLTGGIFSTSWTNCFPIKTVFAGTTQLPLWGFVCYPVLLVKTQIKVNPTRNDISVKTLQDEKFIVR